VTREEDRLKWNTRNELVARKQYIHQLAAEITKRERSKVDGLDSFIIRVYKSLTLSPKSAVSENDFERLVKWMRNCPSHRGIEHLIAPSMGQDRKKNRAFVIRTIVELQSMSGICSEELSDILCTRSMQLSRNSCEFARVMGRADAISMIPTSQKQQLVLRSHSS